MRVTSDSA